MSPDLTPAAASAALTRRAWLQGASVSVLGGTLLGGCGGGGSAVGSASAPSLDPLVTWVDHLGASASQTSALAATRISVQTVVSRHGSTGDGASFVLPESRVTAALPDGALASDWAIAVWLRSDRAAPATWLELLRANGSVALSLRWNSNSAIGWTAPQSGSTAPLSGWGSAGALADGQWHHVLVQRKGGVLQAYFDGAPQGSSTNAPPALTDAPTLRLGGPDWRGDIDSVRLHNVAFDDRQVPPQTYAWKSIRGNVEVDFVAYYPFEGNALNTLGLGLNGVVNGATPAPDRHGDPASAFAFDGAGAFIEVPEAYSPAMSNDWALGFWCLSTSSAAMAAVAVTPGLLAVDLVFNRGNALALYADGIPVDGLGFGASGALSDGAWHFVMVQQRDASVEVYVDGVLRASHAVRLLLAGDGSTFRFGRGSAATAALASPWKGSLDDVQLHERSFSAAEIQNLASLLFTPRDGAGLLAFQGQLWMLGGWNPNGTPVTNSEVWKSDDGAQWRHVTHAPWEGRHTAGWLVFNSRLWVVGGDRNRGYYQHDIWSSADGEQWDLVTSEVPWSGRISPSVLAFQNRMWVIGGTSSGEPAGQGAAYSDVYSSADGVSWRLETPQAPWAPRGLILGGLVFAGRMWIVGGGRYDDGRTYGQDVWSSSDGINWREELAQAPWTGRQYHSVAVHHGKLWVVAGALESQPGGSRDVWYSTDGAHWVELPDTPWPERHAASLASLGNHLWLTCGSNRSLYNDVWALAFA